MSYQDFLLVGPAALGQKLFSPTSPLHPEHYPEYLDELEQKTAAPVTERDFCAASERQVPLTEKWQSLAVIWDSGSNSKQNVCAACSQISQMQGAGR